MTQAMECVMLLSSIYGFLTGIRMLQPHMVIYMLQDLHEMLQRMVEEIFDDESAVVQYTLINPEFNDVMDEFLVEYQGALRLRLLFPRTYKLRYVSFMLGDGSNYLSRLLHIVRNDDLRNSTPEYVMIEDE